LQSTGGFTAAEAYTQHQGLIATQGHRYDPRVLNRILRGKDMLAHDYLALGQARQRWIKHMLAALQGFDAVLSPTVPATSPRLADVGPGAERDAAFFKANALLLRNTSVINMLDGCAISLPCHQLGEMPVGLMIWHGHERDDAVLNMALRAEEALTTARAKIA
jgi:aspartyl-tRNA(Asn)/glutamyl-tRNA(Gln) amidotransferase subunit A